MHARKKTFDRVKARLAIPDLSHLYSEEKIAQLGVAIKQLYPEFGNWPVSLAADAYLWFTGHNPCSPFKTVCREAELLEFIAGAIKKDVTKRSALATVNINRQVKMEIEKRSGERDLIEVEVAAHRN